MTAMIKPPYSNFNSDDCETPPHSKSNILSSLIYSNDNEYKTDIKSKNLSLKSEDTIQISSPKKPPSINDVSLSYPLITTPLLPEKISLPPPKK